MSEPSDLIAKLRDLSILNEGSRGLWAVADELERLACERDELRRFLDPDWRQVMADKVWETFHTWTADIATAVWPKGEAPEELPALRSAIIPAIRDLHDYAFSLEGSVAAAEAEVARLTAALNRERAAPWDG